jgi:hypothetical protein
MKFILYSIFGIIQLLLSLNFFKGQLVQGYTAMDPLLWRRNMRRNMNMKMRIKRLPMHLEAEVANTDKPKWMNRGYEEVIEKDPVKSIEQLNGVSLFDAIYSTGKNGQDVVQLGDSFSQQSLRDISEAFGFSLAFLGDFVVQLGCQTPIDVDAKIGDMMVGGQVASLMEAVHSLDAFEANTEYDSITLQHIMSELNISLKKALKICRAENINLPFGLDTELHSSVQKRLRDVSDLPMYGMTSEEEDEENSNRDAVDAEIL